MPKKSSPPRSPRKSSKACRKAFEAGRKRRQQHPLLMGAYKVNDARVMLQRKEGTLRAIGDIAAGRIKFDAYASIGECCSSERGAYLKRLPEVIAEIFGEHVLPGLEALRGDHVPGGHHADILSEAMRKIDRFIYFCDQVRARLQASLEREYEAMKHGGGDVKVMMQKAYVLIDEQIALIERFSLKVVR